MSLSLEGIKVIDFAGVFVRGQNLMHGYRKNSAADAASFIDGWFRTVDAGALGDDGYVGLAGRIKEMVNRGGEKISATEIDNVFLATREVTGGK